MDEKRGTVFKKKAVSFTVFEFFMRYEINLGVCSIIQLTHIYLIVTKVYIKSV
jgi:hypothetical protein